MKKLTSLFLLILTLTGCSFFDEDDVLDLKVSLSASKKQYSSSEPIEVSTAIKGGTGAYTILWKIDSEEYREGSQTFEMTPTKLKGTHIVYCMVIDNGDTAETKIRLESYAYATSTPVERYGKLQVIGSNLCDEDGLPVQLRGMSTHGLQYYRDLYEGNEVMIQALAEDWKVDIIRLSMYANENGYIPFQTKENGPVYDNREYFKRMIDELVGFAETHGIYVMLDWHMLSPGDPNMIIEHAEEFFTYMAQKHGSKKHVLFEICNEPNDYGPYDFEWNKDKLPYKVTWSGHLKPYAEKIIPIIRTNHENVIIVGTPSYASDPSSVIGNELSFKNVMYTMHFYAASHKDNYRNNVIRAVNAGIPVFVTEFGTQNYAGEDKNDFESSQIWLDLMEEHNISWCNWNISSDWRSGAVYDSWPSTKSDYSNTAKMKEAGKWIFDKIKNR